MAKKKVKKTAVVDMATKERWQRVAYNLQRLRRSKGIATVNDLIDAMSEQEIEVNPSYMRRLESANAPFGSEMEQRFIQFYKVDVSEFYRPIALTEKEREIESVRSALLGIDIDKIKKIRELIAIMYGGKDDEERREDSIVSSEKKIA